MVKKLITAAILFYAAAVTTVGATETFSSSKVDSGDTGWLLMSTAFVMLMTPGLALFYGGMVRKKNVLGTIMHSFRVNDEAESIGLDISQHGESAYT